MIHKSRLLFFLLFSLSLFANEARRKSLVAVINEELKEVVRLSRQISHKDPNLLLRIAELNLEKARILKESENDKFLKLDYKTRTKVNKKRYFRESRKYFIQAQKTALTILNKYNLFRGKDAVFYILAYNAKEFNQFKKARRYFNLAVKNSRAGSAIRKKATLSLAEVYLNDREYRRAIKAYEEGIKGEKDRWWTKDAFNLAWAYFQERQYSRSLKLMLEVFQLSKNSRYIDMSNRVLSDIAFVYVRADRVDQAINFYQRHGKNLTKNLIRISKLLIDKGQKTNAESTLEKAKKITQKREELIEINLLLLGLYEQYGLYNKHYKTSNDLLTLHTQKPLDEASLEVFRFQIKKVSALLQKQVVSKAYKRTGSANQRKGNLAIKYFSILSQLDDKKRYETLFLSAETKYEIKDYEGAVDLYYQAFQASKNLSKSKVKFKAVEGMLASLAQKNVSQKTQAKYLPLAYGSYLSLRSKGKRANRIFQKLFTLNVQKKDIDQAEKNLQNFKKNFPRDLKTQEAMIAQIMDYHRLQNDRDEIKRWVGKINNGEYKVSRKYAKKLKQLLLTLQFESVEKLTSEGDKLRALKGYLDIYDDKTSTSVAKKNAAYNISILFHELGRPKETSLWLERAVKLMNSKDVSKFEESILELTNELFNRRKFLSAASISYQVTSKLCKRKSKRKSLFLKNTYIIYLSESNPKKAKEALTLGVKCKISEKIIEEGRLDLLDYYRDKKLWEQFTSYLNYLKKNKKRAGKLIDFKNTLAEVYRRTGRTSLAKKTETEILKDYAYAKRRRQALAIEALDSVARVKLIQVEKTISSMHSLELKFPEKIFHQSLGRKFSYLDKVTTKLLDILRLGSGVGIVRSYQLLVESYQRLAQEVRNFTPQNVSEDYLKSFKSEIYKITDPLIKKSLEFLEEGKKQIRKSKILSRNNYWFFGKTRLPLELQYFYLRRGVIMDRGGKR